MDLINERWWLRIQTILFCGTPSASESTAVAAFTLQVYHILETFQAVFGYGSLLSRQ